MSGEQPVNQLERGGKAGENQTKEAALQKLATEVIRPLIPPDAEERVARSYKQWNQIIRDHIRTETGLKLSSGDTRFYIPVRVVPGFPSKLAELIGKYRDPMLWRLVIGQPKLGGLVQGLEFLLQGWEQLEKWPSLPGPAKNGRPILEDTLRIATSLQEAALAGEIRRQITAIHEDILGVYRLLPGQVSSVDLYWLPIAMVAAMLDVAIEDLTVVVLIHELAHGYTHIGRDIDGTTWEDMAFSKSSLEVVEGLAQFYTAVISEGLASRTPGFHAAYQALLSLQDGPYRAHLEWLKADKGQRGETVRFTLIAARSHGQVDSTLWEGLMETTRGNLAKHRLFDN